MPAAGLHVEVRLVLQTTPTQNPTPNPTPNATCAPPVFPTVSRAALQICDAELRARLPDLETAIGQRPDLHAKDERGPKVYVMLCDLTVRPRPAIAPACGRRACPRSLVCARRGIVRSTSRRAGSRPRRAACPRQPRDGSCLSHSLLDVADSGGAPQDNRRRGAPPDGLPVALRRPEHPNVGKKVFRAPFETAAAGGGSRTLSRCNGTHPPR